MLPVVTLDNYTFIGTLSQVSTASLNYAQTMTGNSGTVPMYSFKGIQFGQPPIGPLRFLPTVPTSYAQNRTVMATQFALTCPNLFNPTNGTEDCLYLNVWTPTLNPGANLSVMFWIYGGGFVWWGTNMFDAQQLAIRQVVVVTVAYRLGALGFLCTDRPDAPGNMGMYDQLTGLQWTQKYIAQFGGNPNDITVFGESSGAVSTAIHVISSLSNGYFNKAILQSGSILSNYIYNVSAGVATAKRFAAYVGCDPNGDYVNCMRAIPADQLVAAQTLTPVWNQANGRPIQMIADGIPFIPCYGANFMPTNPITMLQNRNFRPDLRVITGHTYNEMAVVGVGVNLVAPVAGRYVPQVSYAYTSPSTAANGIQAIFANTPYGSTLASVYTTANVTLTNPMLRATVIHALSDYGATCTTVLFGYYLALYSGFSVPVNQYYLRYANSQSPCYGSTWCLGATHLDDIPLVFGRPFYQSNFTDTDRFMSATMMDIWTTFAKTGIAPIVNNKQWMPYTQLSGGDVSLNFILLSSNLTHLGNMFINKYNGNNGFTVSAIQNCKNIWNPITMGHFLYSNS